MIQNQQTRNNSVKTLGKINHSKSYAAYTQNQCLCECRCGYDQWAYLQGVQVQSTTGVHYINLADERVCIGRGQ